MSTKMGVNPDSGEEVAVEDVEEEEVDDRGAVTLVKGEGEGILGLGRLTLVFMALRCFFPSR